MQIFLGPAGIPSVSKDIGISSEARGDEMSRASSYKRGTKSTSGGVETVKKLGLNAMEIEFVRKVYLSNREAENVGARAKELGVKLSVHAPYFVNLCNPEKLEASMHRILESAERAHYLGASVVVFHPGFYGKLSKEQAFDLVKSACIEMLARLEKIGVSDVCLGPETMGKQATFGTVDELVKLASEVKNIAPVIDFAHINCRTAGGLKTAQDYGKIFEKLDKIAEKGREKQMQVAQEYMTEGSQLLTGLSRQQTANINKKPTIHTHFTGAEYSVVGAGAGNERYHLDISAEKPPFEPLAREILKRGRSITIISESPLLEQDSLRMKRIFEKLGYKF